MSKQLTAIGQVDISYSVDCPNCGETQYSDGDWNQWSKLEYGDGLPYGTLKCSDCGEEFYVEIES